MSLSCRGVLKPLRISGLSQEKVREDMMPALHSGHTGFSSGDPPAPFARGCGTMGQAAATHKVQWACQHVCCTHTMPYCQTTDAG